MGEKQVYTKADRKELLRKLNERRIKGATRSACYGWNGAPCLRGFARISFKNKPMMAHRAAWIAAKGQIPDFQFVRQSCGNKLCTNPAHLFLSFLKKPRKTQAQRNPNRLHRERLNVDLPTKYVWAIKRFAKKRNITITKYMCILINRAIEIEESYEK